MPTLNPTARYLRAPRLPKVSPVVILHVRADNDSSGNPRRCFAVLTTAGRTVAVHDEDYNGEGEVHARYPWFQHTAARDHGLRPSYAVTVNATPAEYKRWIRQGRDLPTGGDRMPDVVQVERLALAYRKYNAVREALQDVRRHTASAEWRALQAEREGRPNGYADTDAAGAVIYHRNNAAGGDAVSLHLRGAMAAMVAAGQLQRIHLSDACGQYLATDTTPEV